MLFVLSHLIQLWCITAFITIIINYAGTLGAWGESAMPGSQHIIMAAWMRGARDGTAA